MQGQRILFIEDDAAGRELGVFNLKKGGYEVDSAASGESGIGLFSKDKHALVITDLKMPGISGMDVLQAVKSKAPSVPVIVITAYGNIELAVDAMKAGAFDFIGKPFNRDHLLITVEKALQSSRLKQEVQSLSIKASGVERPIVYRSSAMERVIEITDKVAPSEATVLVTGESGTGKELVARRIHVHSNRARGPFVTVNAAAMPAELLESELFGHEKGAFTGAVKSRIGRFRLADSGTVFLDEIGELPLPLQGKLLRVLQEHAVEVVGQDTPVAVNVRVIAATNRDLNTAIKEGAFREDLLYRLNVMEIAIPPLRKRLEDIDVLLHYFVNQFSDGRDLSIPDELVGKLKSHTWPGNIRELENICQRLVLMCQGSELSIDDLPPSHQRSGDIGTTTDNHFLDQWPQLPDDGLSLIDLERGVVERVLEMKDGNVTQAANYLKVPRHVLAYRMEKYGIKRKS